MNNCVFYGRVMYDPVFNDSNGSESIQLKLGIEVFRKSKSLGKVREVTILQFEAWDTAAISLSKFLKRGDFLLVCNSTPKNTKDGVVFRINEFKIIKDSSNT